MNYDSSIIICTNILHVNCHPALSIMPWTYFQLLYFDGNLKHLRKLNKIYSKEHSGLLQKFIANILMIYLFRPLLCLKSSENSISLMFFETVNFLS